MKAKRLSNARGQHWVVYTADQQLYKVACQIIWSDPEQFSPFIPRLGGMHFLMSFIGTVGVNAADSGLVEVMESAFSGVTKMLSGKKFPQNIRALCMVTEELLLETLQSDDIQSMMPSKTVSSISVGRAAQQSYGSTISHTCNDEVCSCRT